MVENLVTAVKHRLAIIRIDGGMQWKNGQIRNRSSTPLQTPDAGRWPTTAKLVAGVAREGIWPVWLQTSVESRYPVFACSCPRQLPDAPGMAAGEDC